jgi:nucleoside-diphosphate-sugar epimerase
MNVLITGATGFVGGSILQEVPDALVVGRSCPVGFKGAYIKKELSSVEYYGDCLNGIDTIVHCAARVHIMKEESINLLQSFREINVDATLNLAKQASKAHVKRFIFISSIKVNGETTTGRSAYSSVEEPKPIDPYGISKYEAEKELRKLCGSVGMDLVIIRPTLVYGKGVKGNFLSLLALSKLLPMQPFGAVHNVRSMVYVKNLTSLVVVCLNHPNAADNVFLASDGDDISLSRLLSLIYKYMNKSLILIPVPITLFRFLGRVFGKSNVIDRLVGDLHVDSSDSKELLGWTPPYTVSEGIKVAVDGFIGEKS